MYFQEPAFPVRALLVRSFIEVQLNLFKATIHSGDMEVAIDRLLLIAA